MAQTHTPTQTGTKSAEGISPEGMDWIEVHEPMSGQLVGTVSVMTADEVRDVVVRARLAQEAWGMLPVDERGKRLLGFRDALMDRSEELVDLLAREAGKPRHEGLLHEVAVAAGLITSFAKHAPTMLAPEERIPDLLKQRKCVITYEPRGVVGLITPWNYPFLMPLRDITLAIMAGNACVVKPSEVTPLVMIKTKEIWDASGMPPDLLGIVTGYGAAGAALIDAGIDMCVFTGSVRTGKRVAAACAERLIPCVMELGGKAPLIACADCDIERTAQGIVNGGFTNSGQACIAVERVYAHRDVHDALLARVVELTGKLRTGDPVGDYCDIGGITFAHQIDVAEAHIADAVAKGAEVRCGGKRRSDGKLAFEPTVLAGCNHDCTVMTEEIFGPIVPFMQVDSEEEAISLANRSHLGLNAYVFTDDAARGRRIAERVQAGSVLVNEVLINGGMGEAPFGGIKESGFGKVMGPEGLRSMCNVKHINVERFRTPPNNPIGFPYTERSYRIMDKALRALYTSGSIFKRIGQLLG